MVNLTMGEYDNYTIAIVGCGGTGSQLVSPLMQLCNKIRKKIYKIIFIDADYIENKNLDNQKFIIDDIGQNKAEVLAMKYSYVFSDLPIEYYDEYITSTKQLEELFRNNHNIIMVGTVDNNATRKVLHEYFINNIYKKVIYVDSGNGTDDRSGQIVVGYKNKRELVLNDVGLAFPQILKTDEKIEEVGTCMRISNGTPQNIATNFYAASILFNILVNILMLDKINQNIVFFDADSYRVMPR